MLKRLSAFTLALVITVVGMIIWSVFGVLSPFLLIVSGPSSILVDLPRFILAALVLGASISLFRRARSFSVSLLLVGAIAFFIVCFHDIGVGLVLDFEWRAAETFLFGYGCQEDPAITTPVNTLRVLGLLIPVGFLCYITPVVEKYLTRRYSEPRAAT